MSSNIERLLDQLIGQKGEMLVIGTLEPIYILKAGKKFPVMNRLVSERELGFIDAEHSNLFSNQTEFLYKNSRIRLNKMDQIREFIIDDGPVLKLPENDHLNQVPPAPSLSQSEIQPENIPTQTMAEPDLPNIDMLLRLLVEKKASDLHLSSNNKPSMRIDGDMVILEEFPAFSSDRLWEILKPIAPERNITEFQETNDTDFAYTIPEVARFRSNFFRDLHGIGAVFRVIPTKILTVDDLKIPPAVVKLCDIPKGLILVTGPTGSGKSTTLSALINYINEKQRKHIITIEDPVEFVHPNQKSLVNQREVSTHTQSFKRALRAALREDPDIILVGEMRDLETIAIAIEMAVTGHLVFGTLHTSTAIGTVDRIIDQFPSSQQQQIRSMLADALIGVIAQTLLKRKTGGRVAAYEILIMTPAISNLIREAKTYQIGTLMQTGKALGMQMINTHLLDLTEKGIVDADEAISKAVDKDNLKSLLKGKNLSFSS